MGNPTWQSWRIAQEIEDLTMDLPMDFPIPRGEFRYETCVSVDLGRRQKEALARLASLVDCTAAKVDRDGMEAVPGPRRVCEIAMGPSWMWVTGWW